MMNINKFLLAAFAMGGCVISSQSVAAEGLKVFKAGDVIKAAEMNSNFSLLQDLANKAQLDFSFKEVAIDCQVDSQALANYLSAPSPTRFTKLKLTGTCEGDSKGELSITRGGLWIEGGEISAQVLVRGMPDISFADVSFTSSLRPEFWVDGGGSAYLQNVTFASGANPVVTGNSALAYNGDISGLDLFANQASRLFFFSPTGVANSVTVETGSALEFTEMSTKTLSASLSASFKGKLLKADDVYINNGASGFTESLVVANELNLKANASLYSDVINGNIIAVLQSSALKTSGNVEATELAVNYASSIRVKGNATLTGFYVNTVSSARVDGTMTATEAAIVDGSTMRADKIAVEKNVFIRRATVQVDSEVNYGTIDAGAFSDLILNMPIATMCQDIGNRSDVVGWSRLESKGYPHDCSN